MALIVNAHTASGNVAVAHAAPVAGLWSMSNLGSSAGALTGVTSAQALDFRRRWRARGVTTTGFRKDISLATARHVPMAVKIYALSGVAVATLPVIATDADGTLLVNFPIDGTASVELAAAVPAVFGEETFIGAVAAPMPPVGVDAAAVEAFTGAGTTSVAAIATTGVGAEVFAGVAAPHVATLAASGAGALIFASTAAVALAPLSVAATSALAFAGVAAAVLRAPAPSATARLAFIGVVDVALPPIGAAVVGELAIPVARFAVQPVKGANISTAPVHEIVLEVSPVAEVVLSVRPAGI